MSARPKPPEALSIFLPVAAGNRGIALGQRSGLQSTSGAAEAKPFPTSSLQHCYHQENEGNCQSQEWGASWVTGKDLVPDGKTAVFTMK